MRYGWNVSDLILPDATYNVTWNPFAVVLTGGHCRFDIAQLFGVYFSSSCNVGYTQVPLTVLFNGNMNENSFLSYLSVDADYCNLNATSAWYECLWQEDVIGGPSCGFTPPQSLTNGTFSFGYQYIQPIWPSQAVREECPDAESLFVAGEKISEEYNNSTHDYSLLFKVTDLTNSGAITKIFTPNCAYNPDHSPNLCFAIPSATSSCIAFDQEPGSEIMEAFADPSCTLNLLIRISIVYRC